jgi:prophage maintenance system killer protein
MRRKEDSALGGTEKYRTIDQKAAALFHSLARNHLFHNGNKRTALVTLVTFVWRNDRRFKNDVDDNDVFNMVVAVANDDFPRPGRRRKPDEVVDALVGWLGDRTATLASKSGGGMKTGSSSRSASRLA